MLKWEGGRLSTDHTFRLEGQFGASRVSSVSRAAAVCTGMCAACGRQLLVAKSGRFARDHDPPPFEMVCLRGAPHTRARPPLHHTLKLNTALQHQLPPACQHMPRIARPICARPICGVCAHIEAQSAETSGLRLRLRLPRPCDAAPLVVGECRSSQATGATKER